MISDSIFVLQNHGLTTKAVKGIFTISVKIQQNVNTKTYLAVPPKSFARPCDFESQTKIGKLKKNSKVF